MKLFNFWAFLFLYSFVPFEFCFSKKTVLGEKNCSASLVIRKMQIKSEIDVTSYSQGKSQEMGVGEGVKRLEVWCAVEIQNGATAVENAMVLSQRF